MSLETVLFSACERQFGTKSSEQTDRQTNNAYIHSTDLETSMHYPSAPPPPSPDSE